MTTPLTPKREQEIRARDAAATPGPWSANEPTGFVVDPTGQPLAIFGGGLQDRADAAFIAHAREDVPTLLAEIERLRSLVANARLQARNEVAGEVVAYCPDHGYHDTCRIACHCDIADEFRNSSVAPTCVPVEEVTR